VTCLDITIEEKWSYSWGLETSGQGSHPKTGVGIFGSRVHQGAFKGRRRSTNAKRLFMGTLFVDVNSCLHLSRSLGAGAGTGVDVGAC